MVVYLASLLGLISLAAAPPSNVSPPAAIFARERAAVGGEARMRVSEIIERGTTTGQGERYNYTTFTDTRSGHSKTDALVANGQSSQGLDATGVWSVNNGIVDIYDGPSNIKSAISAAYIARNGWWKPETDAATFAYLRRETNGAGSFDVVRVVPAGGDALVVWIDASTSLISRIAETDNLNDVTTTRYDDYRRVGDIVYPFASTVGAGDSKYDLRSRVVSVRLLPSVVAADFARPSTRRSGSITSGSKTTIPFDLDNPQRGHIVITARINGSRPLHFIFDTGASNGIRPEIAKELGIVVAGASPLSDAGGTQMTSQIATVRRVQIGNATLKNQSFIVLKLPRSLVNTTPRYEIDGLVGSEVLDNFVVTIDYNSRQMTLADPATFRYSGGGSAVPFTSDGTPAIDAVINGARGRFLFDTGNPGADLSAGFIRKNGLGTSFHNVVSTIVGSPFTAVLSNALVRAKAFSIGPYTLTGVPFAVTNTSHGPLADASLAGNIGGIVLSRFTTTLDYAHRVIYMEPNAMFGAWITGDRTGLAVLVTKPGVLQVTHVVKSSPAASAGIAVDDTIVTVDGRPAYRETLSASSQKSTFTLTIVHDGKRLTRTITPRELLP
jgi:predicted aspartyl protease